MPSDLPPIWVISLERITTRREFVEQVFADVDLPFEIVPAVDARELTAAEVAKYSSTRTMYQYGREIARGLYACTLSHLRILERMVAEDLREVVVFEDDTRPLPEFVDLLRARDRFPDDYDVVTFHSLFEWATPIPVDDQVIADAFKVCRYQRTPMGTQAYLVTLAAARRLLEVAYPVALPPDELLYRPRPGGLRVYGIEPSPVVHEDFPSEVWAPLPPMATHGPLVRAGLEAVRFSGRARGRLDRLVARRDRFAPPHSVP